MKKILLVFILGCTVFSCQMQDNFSEKTTELNGKLVEREYYTAYGLPQCTKRYDEGGQLLQVFLQHYDNDVQVDKTLMIDQNGSALFTEVNKKGKFAYQLKFYFEAIPGQAPLLEGQLDDITDNRLLSRPDLINRLLSGHKKLDWVREKNSKGRVTREIHFLENEDTASVEQFQYDQQGLAIGSEVRYPVDSATRIIEYKQYNAEGNVSSMIKCVQVAGLNDTTGISEFIYNADQLLVKETFINPKDSSYNYERTLSYKNKKLLEEKWKGSGGGQDTKERSIRYEYNEKGWVISKVIGENDAAGKNAMIRYTYQYE